MCAACTLVLNHCASVYVRVCAQGKKCIADLAKFAIAGARVTVYEGADDIGAEKDTSEGSAAAAGAAAAETEHSSRRSAKAKRRCLDMNN